MNSKEFKAMRHLLGRPNEWVSSETLAMECNLTRRQSRMLIGRLRSDCIETDEGNRYVRVVTHGRDPAEMVRELMVERYGIRDEDRERVIGTLSPIGWLSVSDISADTGMSVAAVSLVLDGADGVRSMRDSNAKLYLLNRQEGIPEHVFDGA